MKRLKITGRPKRFLEVLAESGNVTIAAQAAGVSRRGVYFHRQFDDAFAKAWEEAEEVAADKLEAEAWRRAVDGVSEPLVSAGKLVLDGEGNPIAIQRYSDQLLALLLRAHKPDKFRERASVELDISDRLTTRLEAAPSPPRSAGVLSTCSAATEIAPSPGSIRPGSCGDKLIAFTENTATIERQTGTRQTYRRKPPDPGRVLAWELADDER